MERCPQRAPQYPPATVRVPPCAQPKDRSRRRYRQPLDRSRTRNTWPSACPSVECASPCRSCRQPRALSTGSFADLRSHSDRPRENRNEAAQGTEPADEGKAGLVEMDGLAERIAPLEVMDEMTGKILDRGDLKCESNICNLRDESGSVLDQFLGAMGKLGDRSQEGGWRSPEVQHLVCSPMCGKQVLGQVDTI